MHARYTRGWILIPGLILLALALVVHWFVTPLVTLQLPLMGRIMVAAAFAGAALFPLLIFDAVVSEIVRQWLPATCPRCSGRIYYVPQPDPSERAQRQPVEYLCRDCVQRGELKLRYRDVNPQFNNRSSHRR
ncbi:MAG TPA: hypothetical protein VFV87_13530 [Pirellulaceae bacterium]|nr:hypothetical protein [Pirellulaceae bacterium]